MNYSDYQYSFIKIIGPFLFSLRRCEKCGWVGLGVGDPSKLKLHFIDNFILRLSFKILQAEVLLEATYFKILQAEVLLEAKYFKILQTEVLLEAKYFKILQAEVLLEAKYFKILQI